MSNLATRLTKLEASKGGGRIPVWCDDIAGVPATIATMIEAGEIAEQDRERCVFWQLATASGGSHERALEQIACALWKNV